MLGKLLGGLFGVKDGEDNIKVNKEDISWLGDLFKEINRTNQSGLFGGWEWDGNTQRQTVAPEMQPALDQFYDRAAQGPQEYGNAGQFQGLVSALLADRMSGPRGPTPRPPPRQERFFSGDDVDLPPPGIREDLRKRYG